MTDHATKFYTIYGFYIDALQYEYGISKWGVIYDGSLLPADIVPYLITSQFEPHRLDEISMKDLSRYCEDIIRSRMGYFGVGKKWTTEIKLLELVRKIYPNYTVIHQYELDHLKADIFIEELELVIEYQGMQHYQPFSHLGGAEGFKKRQEKDHEKVELCDYYHLGLVYFTYEDQLTEKLVKERISTYIKEKKNEMVTK